MKKLIFCATALIALLFAASCQQENLEPTVEGTTVTYSIQVPGALTTKASEYSGSVDQLVYEVHRVLPEGGTAFLYQQTATIENGVANLSIEFVRNQNFKVLFWAQVAGTYGTSNLRAVTVPESLVSNVDTYEAFYGTDYVENGNKSDKNGKVTLTRAVSLLNVGTTQASLNVGGVNQPNVVLQESKVTLHDFPTVLDIMSGEASGVAELVYTYSTEDEIRVPSETLTVNEVDYVYVAKNFVGFADKDKSTVTVDLEILTDEGLIRHEIPSVPLKRNYKTNIIGDLITASADYTIELNNSWDSEYIVQPDGTVNTNTYVADAAEFATAFAEAFDGEKDNNIITLTGDINLNDLPLVRSGSTEDPAYTLPAGKSLTIDLNGNKLTATTAIADNNGDGKITANFDNQVIFNVRGTMTFKNGSFEYTHTGDDMSWNASTAMFHLEDGATLNVENATLKNLGGSSMAFAIHLNNWGGDLTLNVDNSTLESTYIPVRVFNSGPYMNNVEIKNSTLKGKYCFWVHNYIGAGDSAGEDSTLNINLFNNSNTFEHTGKAPVLYGYANTIYYNADGSKYIADGVGIDTDGNYHISNAAGLVWVAEQVNTMEFYVNEAANIFDNKVVYIESDIDLAGAEWTPIGDYAFSRTSFNGVFDGKNHKVSNFKVTEPVRWEQKVAEASYGFFGNVKGTIKNLTVENATVNPEGGRYSAALVGRLHNGGIIDNCHVISSSVTINHWQVGGLVGQNNNGNIKNCSVVGSTITGKAAVGGIVGMDMVAGEHTIEDCSVVNTKLVQNASFGESYDASYGLAVGLVNASGIILHLNNIELQDNKIKGADSNTLVGDKEEGAVVYVNGSIPVTTPAELAAGIKAGGKYILMNDIAMTEATYQNVDFTLDGNGYTITQASTCTNTYALFDITGGKAQIKNVTFDGVNGGAVVRTVGTEFIADNVTAKNGNHTQVQGLFRLMGKNTIQNCTFKDNTCSMVISLNYDGGNNDPQCVENCVFTNNTCHGTGVLYYVKGAGATINANKFINNEVYVSDGSNAATLYMGFTENNIITNNLFQNNAVTAGTSKRVAGGLMIGYEAVITGNAFVGNTVTATNAKGNDVCASVYYTDIDLSGNYWGGNAPVQDDDLFVEYPDRHVVIINDYLTNNPFEN